jgi:iron complex transport system ATP-binding protein
VILKVKDLGFSYKKGREVLSDISFELKEGEILGVAGPNGTGKTTLLKNINRLLKPRKGEITVCGRDAKKLSVKETAKLIAYVPQYSLSYFPMSVIDCVMMGRLPYSERSYSQKDKELVFSIMEKTRLTDFAFRNIKEISGGERQMVFIARAMAQLPKIIILDEPTSSLDLKNQLFILKVVSDMAKNENYSIIMTQHDLNLASMFCHKLMILKDSRIFAYGDPREILTSENIEIIYGVKTRISEEDGYKHVRLLK